MMTDKETVAAFQEWLAASHAGTLKRFPWCKCEVVYGRCAGHIEVATRGCVRRIWPETIV